MAQEEAVVCAQMLRRRDDFSIEQATKDGSNIEVRLAVGTVWQ